MQRGRGRGRRVVQTTLGKAPPVSTFCNDDNVELPDRSELLRPIQTSVSGLKQVILLYETATEEVRHYLSYECEVIYECKKCRSLHRSIANFILHKREFCKEKYHPQPDTTQSIIHMPDKKCSSKKTIESVISKMVDKQNCEDICTVASKQKDEMNSVIYKSNTVALEPIDRNNSAVFQTVLTSGGEDDEEAEDINLSNKELTKLEVVEIDKVLNHNSAVLSPDGKIADENSLDLVCKFCRARFATKKTLTHHVKYKHNETRIVYLCPLNDCDADVFANTWSVFRHLFKVHRKTHSQVKKLRGMIQTNVLTRGDFEKRIPPSKYKNALKRLDIDNGRWMDNYHGDGTYQICGGCGKRFERRAALNAHAHTCQNNKSFSGYNSADSLEMNEPSKVDEKEKPRKATAQKRQEQRTQTIKTSIDDEKPVTGSRKRKAKYVVKKRKPVTERDIDERMVQLMMKQDDTFSRLLLKEVLKKEESGVAIKVLKTDDNNEEVISLSAKNGEDKDLLTKMGTLNTTESWVESLKKTIENADEEAGVRSAKRVNSEVTKETDAPLKKLIKLDIKVEDISTETATKESELVEDDLQQITIDDEKKKRKGKEDEVVCIDSPMHVNRIRNEVYIPERKSEMMDLKHTKKSRGSYKLLKSRLQQQQQTMNSELVPIDKKQISSGKLPSLEATIAKVKCALSTKPLTEQSWDISPVKDNEFENAPIEKLQMKEECGKTDSSNKMKLQNEEQNIDKSAKLLKESSVTGVDKRNDLVKINNVPQKVQEVLEINIHATKQQSDIKDSAQIQINIEENPSQFKEKLKNVSSVDYSNKKPVDASNKQQLSTEKLSKNSKKQKDTSSGKYVVETPSDFSSVKYSNDELKDAINHKPNKKLEESNVKSTKKKLNVLSEKPTIDEHEKISNVTQSIDKLQDFSILKLSIEKSSGVSSDDPNTTPSMNKACEVSNKESTKKQSQVSIQDLQSVSSSKYRRRPSKASINAPQILPVRVKPDNVVESKHSNSMKRSEISHDEPVKSKPPILLISDSSSNSCLDKFVTSREKKCEVSIALPGGTEISLAESEFLLDKHMNVDNISKAIEELSALKSQNLSMLNSISRSSVACEVSSKEGQRVEDSTAKPNAFRPSALTLDEFNQRNSNEQREFLNMEDILKIEPQDMELEEGDEGGLVNLEEVSNALANINKKQLVVNNEDTIKLEEKLKEGNGLVGIERCDEESEEIQQKFSRRHEDKHIMKVEDVSDMNMKQCMDDEISKLDDFSNCCKEPVKKECKDMKLESNTKLNIQSLKLQKFTDEKKQLSLILKPQEQNNILKDNDLVVNIPCIKSEEDSGDESQPVKSKKDEGCSIKQQQLSSSGANSGTKEKKNLKRQEVLDGGNRSKQLQLLVISDSRVQAKKRQKIFEAKVNLQGVSTRKTLLRNNDGSSSLSVPQSQIASRTSMRKQFVKLQEGSDGGIKSNKPQGISARLKSCSKVTQNESAKLDDEKVQDNTKSVKVSSNNTFPQIQLRLKRFPGDSLSTSSSTSDVIVIEDPVLENGVRADENIDEVVFLSDEEDLITLKSKATPYMDLEALKCNPCNVHYKTIEALLRHMAMHFKWFNFQCDECLFKSYDRASLKQHLSKLHGIKPAAYERHTVRLTHHEIVKNSVEFQSLLFNESGDGGRRSKSSVAADPSVQKMIMEVIFGTNCHAVGKK